MTEDDNEKDIQVLKERVKLYRDEAEKLGEFSELKDQETRDKIQELINAANKYQQKIDSIEQEVKYHRRIIDTVRGVLYVLAAVLTFRLGDVPAIIAKYFG